MNAIRLHNTLSRSKEDFSPITPPHVTLYSCGPTVYHYAHLGNLRGYITTDIVRKTLVRHGYDVKAVINITDVGHNTDDGDEGEDKMEKGARREGKDAWAIARLYTDAFFADLDLLGIDRGAYHFPRATDTIIEQIEMIKTLVDKGYTYTISDGVYFDTSKFSHYKDLALLDLEGLKRGARVEDNPEKKNVSDFALWKFSPEHEKRHMEWESPWGLGFPGWHIECSAMSKKELGTHIDIHMGGIDHIPVHHTNEIAQSECANGEKYVNVWLHYNHLHDKSGKMSKSNDDFLRLQTLLDKGYNPLAYKYYILLTHYRSEMSFSFEALDAAAKRYADIASLCATHRDEAGEVSAIHMESFDEAMYDDINTPKAIAVLSSVMSDSSLSPGSKRATLLAMDTVLGLGLDDARLHQEELTEEVRELIAEREKARAEKDYEKADNLREKLQSLGYQVRDSN